MAKKKAKPKPRKVKKEIIPISKGQQCRARVKTCTKKSCKYRFPAGDKSWHCPECGTYRRCKAKAQYPFTVCRMHGAGGGRPPSSGKFVPPQQIAEAYNALYDDPGLLSLAFNIALSEARTIDLLAMIDDMDIRAQAGEITLKLNGLLHSIYSSALEINAVYEIQKKKEAKAEKAGEVIPKPYEDWNIENVEYMIRLAEEIKESLSPATQAQIVWRQVNDQLEITRRLNDTERRWIDQHDQMVPMSTVLESIAIVIRIALQLIPHPKDRSTFAKKMRALHPSIE